MAAAFQAVKNPLLLAGREIVFAGVSFIGSVTVISSGYQYIDNHMDSERSRDFPTRMKIVAGMNAIGAALPIAVYAGLSKLSMPPGAKLYPMLSQRPPLTIPATIAVSSVAFLLGPFVNASVSFVSTPLIELCHKAAEDISGPKTSMEAIPDIKDHSSSDVATASVEQVPPTADPSLQVSYGMKMGPSLESAVPGSTTVFTPLTEEVFFRGQLFGRLVPHLGCIPAALTSSVLFGVGHRGTKDTYYFPIAEAMLGLACSLLYFRTGRLLVPFALHSGVNVWFEAASAFSSCPMALAEKHICAVNPEACAGNPPELSFWEQRVVNNWSSVKICLVELASTFTAKTASEDAQFLPLDFWRRVEMVSKESIFYDHQHDRLLKAPSYATLTGRFRLSQM
jgi:Type II CAAX prenyl endopeptidase Rce1-like